MTFLGHFGQRIHNPTEIMTKKQCFDKKDKKAVFCVVLAKIVLTAVHTTLLTVLHY